MAYINTSSARPVAAVRAPSMLRRLVDNWRRHRIYRETLNELHSLSRRELDDLGLNATMIRSVAYKAAYEI